MVLRNNGMKDWHYKRGQKIAQLLVKRYVSPRVHETDQLSDTLRGAGAFGSTGTGLVADAAAAPVWGADCIDVADQSVRVALAECSGHDSSMDH